jgi:hypothetical protein
VYDDDCGSEKPVEAAREFAKSYGDKIWKIKMETV